MCVTMAYTHELRSICVGALSEADSQNEGETQTGLKHSYSICHRQEERSIVLVLGKECFILEFLAINGFTTSPISSSEISALDHEPGVYRLVSRPPREQRRADPLMTRWNVLPL